MIPLPASSTRRTRSRRVSWLYPIGSHVPRKPNYNFEKQRKEQNRQAKKEAKREEKLRRKQQEELQRPPEPTPEVE